MSPIVALQTSYYVVSMLLAPYCSSTNGFQPIMSVIGGMLRVEVFNRFNDEYAPFIHVSTCHFLLLAALTVV